MPNSQGAKDLRTRPTVGLSSPSVWSPFVSFSFSHEHFCLVSTKAPLLWVLVTDLNSSPGEPSYKGSSLRDEPTLLGLTSSDFPSVSYIWRLPLALPSGGQYSDPKDMFYCPSCVTSPKHLTILEISFSISFWTIALSQVFYSLLSDCFFWGLLSGFRLKYSLGVPILGSIFSPP